ncbi:hypothetical protein PF005_g22840 [Phytophthora fragariae]|uniref:Uncharacterized protein n=1 Tax=Phytophthora fragariae TaxID=53985 RepID=A0A6A3R952_9STRA|nr:hypothetical protein PF003_g37935 [Phytophthora fragariae]KAE8922379.1 hypothetical protein PF009_g27359 [Phytophthora fragariae]KAE8975374.1 hypothetical protein PF011_g24496 [Phytophthora fragariae]KAE9070416.1 hypothetical protein PF010_g26283 [Phytophthora fragariae]KAE9070967.1 hypothetical protein PF007_g26730 [Phytophthora fragariae]
MIVYDATNRSSLEYVTGWLVQVDEHAHESLVLMLVGSKCNPAHLPESREVSTLEAARFAAKYSWSAMWSVSVVLPSPEDPDPMSSVMVPGSAHPLMV